MSSDPLRASGVSADAVDHLREQIRLGRYEAGERITERAVADELGISTIAVRDAFARLAQEGWIERLPRRGVRVRMLDADEIEDVATLRGLLEGEAAARAARRIGDGDRLDPIAASALDLMAATPAAMARAARRDDRRALLALDDAFHAALWHLGASTTLEELLQNLRARITPFIRRSLDTLPHGDLPLMADWHAELLAAIHEGPQPARAAVARHTERTRLRVLAAGTDL